MPPPPPKAGESMSPDFGHSFVKDIHAKPYPAIAPDQPHLAQTGKTVVISGGSQGIGYAIAKAFATAGATHIVITARSEGPLAEAKKTLEAAFPHTKVYPYASNITDLARTASIFAEIRARVGEPDILVTCAGLLNERHHVMAITPEDMWNCFEVNVKGNMGFVREFLGPDAVHVGHKAKTIVNVSTVSAHLHQPEMGAYGASKQAYVHLLAHVQNDYKDQAVRVHNFHPGIIFTQMVQAGGYDFAWWDWDDVDLAGRVALWLASPEAAFLAGRFIWAGWDVEELKSRAKEIEDDPHLLTINLIGKGYEPGVGKRVD
ncbi:hypothetical protein MMC19_006558 [Ptychographa xylographoides]|nr:hypothetical protein [Ptychographa xylographoides]